MRPLKFRCWDKLNKRMCLVWDIGWKAWDNPDPDGGLALNGVTVYLFDNPDGTYDLLESQVILMQFTGLFDKTGKEIWEGDVVQYCYQPGAGMWNMNDRAVISWKSTGFHIEAIGGGFFGWLTSIPGASASDQPNKLFEVLGNIYSNPELLEKK